MKRDFGRNRLSSSGWGYVLLFSSCLSLGLSLPSRAEQRAGDLTLPEGTSRPLVVVADLAEHDAVEVKLDFEAVAAIRTGAGMHTVLFPVDSRDSIALELERFDVTTATTRFVQATPSGQVDRPRPDVVMFRGEVSGEPQSRAFLSFASNGSALGYVMLESGKQYLLSHQRSVAGSPSGTQRLTIHRASTHGTLPDFPMFCGVADEPVSLGHPGVASRGAPFLGSPQVATVAVDGDRAFVDLLGSASAAETYIVQVIGAVSDIYIRDLNVKLLLTFVRVWPEGGEPFTADDYLESLTNHWLDNEDMTGLNLVHLFSGRRDLPYGGVAYLGGTCSGGTFGISGYMLGGFPTPVQSPHLGNWDLQVVAHEMGHNMGAPHTHSYSPPIDQCASGVWSRSTIMSYCHTTPGGLLNTDMRFHRLIQDVIADDVAIGGCLWYDCNDNDIDDADDLVGGTSVDTNTNGVPDSCEDCNNNGTLDSVEISGGAPDIDGNGVLDECELDCNTNSLPDAYETEIGLAPDANGNLSPDTCDPDCNNNAVPDFAEIASGALDDLDRDTVPDICQDCDNNGTTDWIDLDRQHNVYVADFGHFVREYHGASGVAVQNLASGIVSSPMDLTFGADGQLYVASFGNDQIVRVDVDTGVASVFVPSGSGGLAGPAGLTFGPNGNLFVSSNTSQEVIEYDGLTGALIGVFASAASPYSLTFGPNGNLFVASGFDTVLEYSGEDGSYLGMFVSAGSGGLSQPRGLVFRPNGNLLVASHGSDRVIQYGPTGMLLGVFNDAVVPTGAWGVQLGPNGNVFVTRHTGTLRVLEYDVTTGRYVRSFIRGDTGMVAPTGLTFRPASEDDCNGNRVLDVCDIAEGTSLDDDDDGVPDECAVVCVPVSAPQAELNPFPTNRYLSFVPGNVGRPTGIRVRFTSLPPPHDVWNGRTMWVGQPQEVCENSGQVVPPEGGCGPAPGLPSTIFHAATLDCEPYFTTDWSDSGTVHVYHDALVPGGNYDVQVIHQACDTASEDDYSDPLSLTTSIWGDIVSDCTTDPCGAPDGEIHVTTDVTAVLDRFKNLEGAPTKARCDIEPQRPDLKINITDVTHVLGAFGGGTYPFPLAPDPCG